MKNIEILKMSVGKEMDKIITAAMINITDEQYEVKPYSTDQLAALELWDFAEKIWTVCISRDSMSPILISQMCIIKDEEENEVIVMMKDWKESLAKAFLLFTNELWGEYVNPEFEKVKNMAPMRIFN